jgi:hypothetical protein
VTFNRASPLGNYRYHPAVKIQKTEHVRTMPGPRLPWRIGHSESVLLFSSLYQIPHLALSSACTSAGSSVVGFWNTPSLLASMMNVANNSIGCDVRFCAM